jgi:hypothetical protein
MGQMMTLFAKRLLILSISLVLPLASAWGQWVQTAGPSDAWVSALAARNSVLLAGTAHPGLNEGGAFRSTDGGTHWDLPVAGVPNLQIQSFASINSNLFLSAVFGGVYRSTNEGATWSVQDTGLTSLDCYPLMARDSTLFVGVYWGGAFKSTDLGEHWTSAGLESQFPWCFTTVGQSIYAGCSYASGHAGSGGVFLSTDDGASWQSVGLSGRFVSNIALMGSTMYAAARTEGVFRSTDNGVTWDSVNAGIPGGTDIYTLLAIGSDIFAGTATVGVGPFLSTDRGATWVEVKTGLSDTSSPGYLVNVGGDLYLGTYGDGVWKRSLAEMIPVQESGLLAYFPFSGTANDASGNGNHGILHNAALSADRFGAPDKAYYFNGVDSWIEVPDNPILRPDSAITMAAWVRIDSGVVSDSKTILEKGSSPGVNSDFALMVDNTQTPGSMRCRPHMWLAGGWQFFNGTTQIDSATWYHLAMTYDGFTMKSYVNGINDGSKVVTSKIRGSNTPLRIGLYEPTTAPARFPGQIDEVRIYSRALSEVEIATLAGNGSLPIALLSFKVTLMDDSRVRLIWETLSEVNNYGFEVQVSVNPTTGFQTIPNSFVPGHGTTNDRHRYSFADPAQVRGFCYYRLRQIDLDGSDHYSEAIQTKNATSVSTNAIPVDFSLAQNFPNPFNPSTVIQYGLPHAATVRLDIFNVLGELVATLVDEPQKSGYHEVRFDAAGLASGIYFYRIISGEHIASRKLLLLR